MALKKRGKTWHTHFFVDGERFRQSLETSDWREAQRKERDTDWRGQGGQARCEQRRLLAASLLRRGGAVPRGSHPAPCASQHTNGAGTGEAYQQGSWRGCRLAYDVPRRLSRYIRERKAAGRSNATINRELDIIRGVLKRAKRWHHFAEEIHPLPVRQNIGRALTYEEKVKLLHRAAARPEWQTAACAARLALNTTMRGCEIKELRWRDVDMIGRSLTVRKSKTEAGERVIPSERGCLGGDSGALQALTGAWSGFEPSHFLFPACETAHIRPYKAASRVGERHGDG